jgi:thymidylate synthase
MVHSNPQVQPTVRKIKTKEVMHMAFTLTDPTNNWVESKTRNANREYAETFAQHLLTGEKLDLLIALNPSAYRYISNKHLPDNFSTSYSDRIRRQLPRIIRHLKEDPESRRAVIHILEESDKLLLDIPLATMEYPCTSMLQFLLRDGELHMFTMMRSQNVALTIVYDVFNFTMLQMHVARELGVELGTYNHYMVSAHYFDKEEDIVKLIIDEYDKA